MTTLRHSGPWDRSRHLSGTVGDREPYREVYAFLTKVIGEPGFAWMKYDRAAVAILKLWRRRQRTCKGTDSGRVELRSQLPAAACFWLVHLVRTITLYFVGGHYTWIFSHMHLNIVLTDTIYMPSKNLKMLIMTTFEQSNYFPFTVIF